MLINELSKETGVSIHTIRFYENKGLIQGTIDESIKTNKYRNYDETHVEKIAVIKEAQEVGFTLSEIKILLDKWYSGKFSKEDQLKFFDAKIKEVDNKITQLNMAKKRLEEVKKTIERGEC
jgi:MerR family Zn(II)-responsive transcriptional regulator of zntA